MRVGLRHLSPCAACITVSCITSAPSQSLPLAGYEAYRTGDWPAARAVFEETVAMRRNRCGDPVSDGPSATLLR